MASPKFVATEFQGSGLRRDDHDLVEVWVRVLTQRAPPSVPPSGEKLFPSFAVPRRLMAHDLVVVCRRDIRLCPPSLGDRHKRCANTTQRERCRNLGRHVHAPRLARTTGLGGRPRRNLAAAKKGSAGVLPGSRSRNDRITSSSATALATCSYRGKRPAASTRAKAVVFDDATVGSKPVMAAGSGRSASAGTTPDCLIASGL